MSENTERLFLLDAYALIFRAYYALIRVPRLTTDGFNTSAVFGFVNTLEELLRKEQPTHLAVCFDPPGPTFRHEAYEGYKAERSATPEDIKRSVPIIKEIIEAYRLPVIEVAGFEADDVIGTLSRQAAEKGYMTYMMSPDKDFGQLVNDHVWQYKPSYRGQDFELRGPAEVCARYGIDNPLQVIDILALMGDKIDNIPGCPGVGEKTAIKLIHDFGGVDPLLERTAELKGALKKKVEDNAEQIRFSKFLATIRTDVPVDTDLQQLRVGEPDLNALFKIFDRLEFRTLRTRVEKRINGEKQSSSPKVSAQPSLFDFDNESAETVMTEPAAPDYTIVDNDDVLARFRAEAAEAVECAIVADARGESDADARWRGTAVAFPSGHVWWLDTQNISACKALIELTGNHKIRKVCPDVKRFIVAARKEDTGTRPMINYYDTSVAHYLIEPEGRHTLPALSERYLNRSLPQMPPLKPKRGETQASDAEIESICATWAVAALDIYPKLDTAINQLGMDSLLADMELPLVEVLADMESAGVRIDIHALENAGSGLEERLTALENEIYALAGETFNVSSPSKVGEILFDRLGLDPKAKKTKTGQYSTSEEVLEKLSASHPIIGMILEYRKIKKLLSTYINALPQYIDPADGKIHTTFNQTVTATGRISSSDPNLQNIPVREEMGRDIRRAFIPDEGHLFLSADYSQIELRLAADMAEDAVMLEAFANNRDIHAITASRIYKKPLEEVTADERRHAKTANFGILYGISAFGLSQRLSIPRADAKALIDGYFNTFPTIKAYMERSIELARQHKYVVTQLGRRRMLPDIDSRNPVVRGYAERNAINAPIQGTAADIIKTAMVRIADEIRRRRLKSRMIMQVHDELNFDVPPDEADEMKELVTTLMSEAYNGRVCMEASCGVGANWLEAH